MPQEASDAGELMLGMKRRVDPAIDAAIAHGLTDADRVFVLGHSFGGLQ